MKESRFIYTSTCCGVPASKPACVKPAHAPKKKNKKGDRDKAPEFATLGHWSCGNCGKSCKVTVSVRPPKEMKATQ